MVYVFITGKGSNVRRLLFVTAFIASLCSFRFAFSADSTEERSDPSAWQTVLYETSLYYTKISGGEWWTHLEPYNLYLGALPLENMGHKEAIADLGVTDVLVLAETFELETGWFNTPVKVCDWEERGIGVLQIPATDFLPLTAEQIDLGIQYLTQTLDGGGTVYVHCKAGRGRSATVVIAYLMTVHDLTFDDAFALVKEQREQINLNTAQRQAIYDYFDEEDGTLQDQGLVSGERVADFIERALEVVIEGGTFSSVEYLPEALPAWLPELKINSTLSRRNRYLREFQGDQDLAIQAAIERNHSLTRRLQNLALQAMPFIGTPVGYSLIIWYQLREIALIAAIHGHDLHERATKVKILSALVGGDLMKVPAHAVDIASRTLVKEMLLKVGFENIGFSVIPAHLIFNFFTENSAKVSTYAKELFAGEHSVPCLFR